MKHRGPAALFEILADLQGLEEERQIDDVAARILDRYGLKTVAYLGTGLNRARLSEPYLAVTYSSDWVEHYKQRRYVEIDPVVRIGLRQLLPLDWDDLDRHEGSLRTFFGEASEFGLGQRGLSIPIHGRHGDRGLFSITSDLSEHAWARDKLHYMRDFQVLATHLHDMILRLAGRVSEPASLSPRERECLQWVAEGKTAWECAVILGLSEHTVRCYLESARHKLNAASNTHAVTIAHRTGILFSVM